MKKILLLFLVIPLISWDTDQKIPPYIKRSIDSLEKLKGTKIYSKGDTIIVSYLEDMHRKSFTVINAPIILGNKNTLTNNN